MLVARGLSPDRDPFQETKGDPWIALGATVATAHAAVATPPEMEAMAAEIGAGAAVAAAHAAAAGANISPTPFRQCKALRHEDVEKSTKYIGNTDAWLRWAKSFKKFLRRTNAQWLQILKKIEGLKGKPVTTTHDAKWASELRLGSRDA